MTAPAKLTDDTPSLTDFVMGREEVAMRLGVSVSTVRRMEGDELPCRKDERGRYRFRSADVERLWRQRRAGEPSSSTSETTSTSIAEGRVAEAFEHLEAGATVMQLVTRHGFAPSEAQAAGVAWNEALQAQASIERTREAQGFVVTLEDIATARALGLFPPTERGTPTTAGQLLDVLHRGAQAVRKEVQGRVKRDVQLQIAQVKARTQVQLAQLAADTKAAAG